MTYQPRFWRKKSVLCKIEATPGTPNPPAAADFLLGSNVQFTPLVAQRLSRDLMLPFLGNQGVMLTGYYATIEMDIELAGSGVAGTPPRWGSAIRLAGMAETIDAGVSVTYERADYPQDTGTIYINIDGVRHVLLYCRANAVLNYSTTAIPRTRVSFTGLLGTVTAQPNPTVSKTGWVTPLPVNKLNTALTVHGWAATGQSFSADFGNTVTPRFLIGDEAVLITDQNAKANITIDAPPIGTIDFDAKAKSRERGIIHFQHGQTAGNIVEYAAEYTELGAPQHGESDGVLTYTIEADVCVEAGFDDFTIVVR